MIKIGEFKGEKGFMKSVKANGFYDAITYVLKFSEKNKHMNCEIKDNGFIFCATDDMTVEVWSSASDLSDYDFKLITHKTQDFA